MDLGPVSQLSATVGNWSGRTRIFRRFSRGWGVLLQGRTSGGNLPFPLERDVFQEETPAQTPEKGAAPEQPAAQEEQAREARMARKPIHSTGGFWLILGRCCWRRPFGLFWAAWRRRCMSWGTWQRAGPGRPVGSFG
ncbi:MAG: hypothetical protein ACLS43_08105 [Evtepia gabavorous]